MVRCNCSSWFCARTFPPTIDVLDLQLESGVFAEEKCQLGSWTSVGPCGSTNQCDPHFPVRSCDSIHHSCQGPPCWNQRVLMNENDISRLNVSCGMIPLHETKHLSDVLMRPSGPEVSVSRPDRGSTSSFKEGLVSS